MNNITTDGRFSNNSKSTDSESYNHRDFKKLKAAKKTKDIMTIMSPNSNSVSAAAKSNMMGNSKSRKSGPAEGSTTLGMDEFMMVGSPKDVHMRNAASAWSINDGSHGGKRDKFNKDNESEESSSNSSSSSKSSSSSSMSKSSNNSASKHSISSKSSKTNSGSTVSNGQASNSAEDSGDSDQGILSLGDIEVDTEAHDKNVPSTSTSSPSTSPKSKKSVILKKKSVVKKKSVASGVSPKKKKSVVSPKKKSTVMVSGK